MDSSIRYLVTLLVGFGLGYYAAKGPPTDWTKAVPLNVRTPAPDTPDWVHDPNRKTKLDATPAPVPYRVSQ